MEKELIIELWQEKMSESISEEREQLLNELLAKDEAMSKELAEMEQTWHLFDQIERPEPSAQMDANFDELLAKQLKSSQPTRTVFDLILARISSSWQVGLATLIIGLFAGWWLLPSQDQKQDIKQLSSEIQSMKEMMMLTLIEQPKAQERIRAVNLASELPDADEQVINALITTLNNDVNVNVRLASLESLLKYSDRAIVRQALIDALGMQDSALMQVAIADALVQIQEKSSLNAMEELKEGVENDIVKEKLEQSIQTLKQS